MCCRQAPLATAVSSLSTWHPQSNDSPSVYTTRPKSSKPLTLLPGMLLLPIIHCFQLAQGLPALSQSWVPELYGRLDGCHQSTSTAQWCYIVLRATWPMIFVFVSLQQSWHFQHLLAVSSLPKTRHEHGVKLRLRHPGQDSHHAVLRPSSSNRPL